MASICDETQQQMESQAIDLRAAIDRVQRASLMQKQSLAIEAIEQACDLLDVMIADRGDVIRQLEHNSHSNRLLTQRVEGLEKLNGIL